MWGEGGQGWGGGIVDKNIYKYIYILRSITSHLHMVKVAGIVNHEKDPAYGTVSSMERGEIHSSDDQQIYSTA